MTKHTKEWNWGFCDGAFNPVAINQFDGEAGDPTLPYAKIIKERKWIQGRPVTIATNSEHDDGSFPMFIQSDTWISGAVVAYNSLGEDASNYSFYWDDGDSGYVCVNGSIKEYTIEGRATDSPMQTMNCGFEYMDQTGVIAACPDRDHDLSTAITKSDLTFTFNGVTEDVVDFNVSINAEAEVTDLATTFKKGPGLNKKKQINVEFTTEHEKSWMGDIGVSGVTDYAWSLQLGTLGTLSASKMVVKDVDPNAIVGEGDKKNYSVKLENESGCTLGWS